MLQVLHLKVENYVHIKFKRFKIDISLQFTLKYFVLFFYNVLEEK
jgi:hypothetical protein